MKNTKSSPWDISIRNLGQPAEEKPKPAAAKKQDRRADDDYGNAPEMIVRQIIDPLTDEEHAELTAQVAILQQIIDQRIRIPSVLMNQLATLEKRAIHTADDGLIWNLVMDAHRRGLPLTNPKDHSGSAYEDAANKLGMVAKTVCNRFQQIKAANTYTDKTPAEGLPPLANTPKS